MSLNAFQSPFVVSPIFYTASLTSLALRSFTSDANFRMDPSASSHALVIPLATASSSPTRASLAGASSVMTTRATRRDAPGRDARVPPPLSF